MIKYIFLYSDYLQENMMKILSNSVTKATTFLGNLLVPQCTRIL